MALRWALASTCFIATASVTGFEHQLLVSSRSSVSCPNCRVVFFNAECLTERSIITSSTAFDMLGERNPKFIDITREAERRMRQVGKVTEDIVTWALHQRMKIDPRIEEQYRGTHYFQEYRLARVVNVNTERAEVVEQG